MDAPDGRSDGPLGGPSAAAPAHSATERANPASGQGDLAQATKVLLAKDIQYMLDIMTEFALIPIAETTCDVHELCDGSCTGARPVTYPRLFVRQRQPMLDVRVISTKPSTLPRVRDHPVAIPTVRYAYSPIDSERGEVRVIKVHEAVFRDDPVVLEVKTINIRSPNYPKYAALSYSWGQPMFDHEIVCDGKLLRINKSLHDSLKRHRADHSHHTHLDVRPKPAYLWADAICINQQDPAELNQQLPLMHDIYSGADVVFIDLGDIPSWFCYAVELMFRARVISDELEVDPESPGFFHQLGIGHVGLEVWRIFFRAFRSPWFERTWTVQEAVLARVRRARIGRFAFDWTDMLRISYLARHQAVPHLSIADLDSLQGHANFLRMERIRAGFRGGSLSPTKLLWLTRQCRVSNPRDRIVALLGLINGGGGKTFRPDYGWPAQRISYEFNAFVLCNYGHAERVAMLSYAGLHMRSGREGASNRLSSWAPDCRLPSWAPDWLAICGVRPPALATIRNKAFATTKGTQPIMHLHGDYDKGDMFLSQTAYSLGRIIAASSSKDNYFYDPDELATIVTQNEEARRRGGAGMAIDSIHRATDRRWLTWYRAAFSTFHAALVAGQIDTTRYAEPEDAFAIALLVGDQYIGECATDTSIPITDPKGTLGELISLIEKQSRAEEGTKTVADLHTQRRPVAMYHMQTMTATCNRSFAVTDQGWMGLVPSCSRAATRTSADIASEDGEMPETVKQDGHGKKERGEGKAKDEEVFTGEAKQDAMTERAGHEGATTTHVADEVVLLSGAPVPFVMRPVDAALSSYKLVGDAYIHGVMEGELMDEMMDEFRKRGFNDARWPSEEGNILPKKWRPITLV